MVPSHYLNQCWNIVNWTLRNQTSVKSQSESKHFHLRKCIWNVFWKMAAILSRPQYVNSSYRHHCFWWPEEQGHHEPWFKPWFHFELFSPCVITCSHKGLSVIHYYTPAQWSCWGVYWIHSVCPSVPHSCPLCSAYSSGWIHFIFYTSYRATSGVSYIKFIARFQNFNFWQIFNFLTLILSCFDLGSDVNH